MMRWVVIILCCMQSAGYANVALEQLNAKLAEKVHVTVPVTSSLIKDLSEHYYFVFIYRSTCPHCHALGPVLNDFANTFHVDVKAYGMDNTPFDGFVSYPLTPELFQTFYAAGGYKPIVPAIFLVNRDTLQAYAVLFGEASPYQLAKRVNELMQHIQGRFND